MCGRERRPDRNGISRDMGALMRPVEGAMCAMPRQRTLYITRPRAFPGDFPERLKRFQKESGLSWSEISRRLGTYRHTVWRWKEGRGRPNAEHMIALHDLAEELGLLHIFTD